MSSREPALGGPSPGQNGRRGRATAHGEPEPARPRPGNRIKRVGLDTKAGRAATAFAWREPASGPPAAFALRRDRIAGPETLFRELSATFGLARDDRMEHRRRTEAPNGVVLHRFVQRFRKVEVVGGGYVVREVGTLLVGAGAVIGSIRGTTKPRLSAAKALAIASAAVDGAPLEADPSLVMAPSSRPTGGSRRRLAWRCVVSGGMPLAVDVDADDGDILGTSPRTIAAWQEVDAQATTCHHGVHGIRAQKDSETSQLRLRSARAVTWDLNGASSTPSPTDASLVDVTATTAFSDLDVRPGASVHWAAERTLDFIAERFGRTGVDGLGGVVHQFVDWGGGDATWLPSNAAAYYGTSPEGPLVAINTVAHELAHGIQCAEIGTASQPGLEPIGESGALGEAFADILGREVEAAALPAEADWVHGEDDMPADRQRDMADPHTTYRPDRYEGIYWRSTAQPFDQGGIHFNCTVVEHWYYLLVTGNDSVTAIDPARALQIAYLGMLALNHTSPFADARTQTIAAAQQQYGEQSVEDAACTNAWHAVDVGSEFAPFRAPEDAATDVEPWPCRLRFEVPDSAVDVEIQLASDQDFTVDVEQVPLSDLVADQLPDGTAIGEAKLDLQPGQTYWWRLRALPTPPSGDGWSPPGRFRTAAQVPAPVWPAGAPSQRPSRPRRLVYPWDVEFEWEEVAGAARYEMQLWRADAGTDPSPADLLYEIPPTQGTKLETPAAVDETNAWRVRAIRSDENVSAWSPPTHFKTSLPRVRLIRPVDGELVYPWGIDLQWEEVAGADHYILDWKLPKDEDDLDGIELPADATNYVVNVPVSDDGVEHWEWNIRVVGPEPLSEEGGEQIGDGTFAANPWETMPEPLFPPPKQWWSDDPFPCVPFGERVGFRWKSVPLAEGYHFRLYPLHCEQPHVVPVTVSAGDDAIFDTTVYGLGDEPSYPLDNASSPAARVTQLGFAYEIQARGPDGLDGYATGPWPYFVRPPRPVLSNDEAEFEIDAPVVLEWYSEHSHNGGFLLEVSNVGPGGAVEFSTPVHGLSHGFNEAVLENVDGGDHWWRVRPWIFNGCDQTPQWSGNGHFNMKQTPEEPAADTRCDETVQSGGAAGGVHVVDVGADRGPVTLSYRTFVVHDRILVDYEGEIVFDSGCIATGDEWVDAVVDFGPGSHQVITVLVASNCNWRTASAGDIWEWVVSC